MQASMRVSEHERTPGAFAVGYLAPIDFGPSGRGPHRLTNEAREAAARELVARVRMGDEAAFGELFAIFRGDVARVCRRMLGGSASEDAAQEIFLRARRGIPGYQDDRAFRPWLVAIASNYCLDLLRRQKSERLLFDAEELESGTLATAGPSPLRQLVDREQRDSLLNAIDRLPRKYRLPLVLRYFHELDYDGIAELLGITRSQVGTLLFRAKQKVRAQIHSASRSEETSQ